ncbi:MAG: redoxin domain-containing protein [Sediminibacterium sp.]|nr:redoxin domain-containing protein [Sediminibacterium sp.]
MKYILCLMVVLCHQRLFSQATQPLTVGDRVHDRALQPILNASYTTYRLNAEAGKLFILDFFDTRCGSCISALPMLDSLQNHFGEAVSILVVSSESSATISKFLKTNPRVKHVRLPFLTDDSILHHTFPHYLLPHEVWIKNGKVIAITEASAINHSNLQAALSEAGIRLSIKRDLLEFNHNIPLHSQLSAIDSTLFLRQNLLTRQVDGLGSRRGNQLIAGKKRIYFINWELLSLFQHAWEFQANRVLLEVPDPALYLDKYTAPDEWKRNNLYCYEGIFPENCPDSLVLEDLKTSLQSASPLNGSWQNRELPCYVLSAEGNGPVRSNAERQAYRKDNLSDSIFMQSHSLLAITAIFNNATKATPRKAIIVDETGIDYPVDIVIPFKALSDPALLTEALIPYKLKLTPAKRHLRVFVLTENQSYNF